MLRGRGTETIGSERARGGRGRGVAARTLLVPTRGERDPDRVRDARDDRTEVSDDVVFRDAQNAPPERSERAVPMRVEARTLV